METDLISMMFTQFTSNLSSFISNDISVILLAMLSLLFVVFAFCKIQEIFNIGMTEGEIGAKKAFGRWQSVITSYSIHYTKLYEKKVVPLANIPMGLSLKGLIMEKIAGTTSKGDETFHLSVAVKGLEQFLKIKVSKEVFENQTEMTPYANSITFREFNA